MPCGCSGKPPKGVYTRNVTIAHTSLLSACMGPYMQLLAETTRRYNCWEYHILVDDAYASGNILASGRRHCMMLTKQITSAPLPCERGLPPPWRAPPSPLRPATCRAVPSTVMASPPFLEAHADDTSCSSVDRCGFGRGQDPMPIARAGHHCAKHAPAGTQLVDLGLRVGGALLLRPQPHRLQLPRLRRSRPLLCCRLHSLKPNSPHPQRGTYMRKTMQQPSGQ